MTVRAFAAKQLPSERNIILSTSSLTTNNGQAYLDRPSALVEFLRIINISQGVYGVASEMRSWLEDECFGQLLRSSNDEELSPAEEAIEIPIRTKYCSYLQG
jgi:hypothetical protein